ncbi:MAG: sugar phosphate isomerase/epimerase [Planctomycetes bacterium]|nr:sugar phosphate isomerase/epimerase [Planctomycetota bacterium]
MKVGIDSYCYHRFFGEVYAQQQTPSKSMTLEDFLDRAHELQVDGVSLESCFIPKKDDPGYLQSVRDRLDEYGFDRVYAWGHPDGLEGGNNKAEYDEMIRSLKHAQQIGAGVMRVVGSSFTFRFEDHQSQITRLVTMFKEAVKLAADCDIKLAIENHIDFTGDEILQLLEEVDSPYLGLNFDTGNFARLLDDPVKAMEKLAPYTLATHIKDLKINPEAAVDDWYFFSTTPVGDGFIDNFALAQLLKKANYQGFLAMEFDFLHPEYNADEDAAVARSVEVLRQISDQVEKTQDATELSVGK